MPLIKKNNRGSTTVFLCMILSCVLFLVGMFGEAAAGMASRIYANSVFDLAGRSILSEYDRILKSQYGIFGFVLEEEDIESRMKDYVCASFTKGTGKTELLPLEIQDLNIDLSEYVMTKPELLEKQILDHMNYRVFFEAMHAVDALKFIEEERVVEKTNDEAIKKMRTLRSGKVIERLPSRLMRGMDGGFHSILDLPPPGEMGEIAYREFCLNFYILKYFRHNLDSYEWNNTFFSNEIEYILCGRLSDKANQSIVYTSLIAFRTVMNVVHIQSDPNKREAVMIAAALAGGGVATLAAQATITGIWAGAEAVSDMNRLEKGGRVPLIKTSEDWVLGLNNALDGDLDVGDSFTEKDEGQSYEDYLFLLLCFKDKESKLIRIMDLIELNIKGMVNENFSMSRCYSGFGFKSQVVRQKGFPAVFPMRRGEFTGIHVY